MKIAILTQPLGKNYGGIMQGWALQQVLTCMGHEVVTIDRQPDKRSLFIRLLLPFKPLIFKVLGRKYIPSLSAQQSDYVFAGLVNFVNKNMVMSEPINSTPQLKAHYQQNQYQLVVVGSDQVWRPRYSPNIYNFFVDFIEPNDKAITYAASFGVDEWEYDHEQSQTCKKLAQRFNAVSVREKSAIDLCKNQLGIEAEFVLDPTLLVSASDYGKLIIDKNTKAKGKVFSYLLDPSNQKQALVEEVAQHLNKATHSGLPAKDPRNAASSNDFAQIDDYKYPTVEAWISGFRDADFVITDSFHGCVFSIIFNKPFIAIGNIDRGLSRFHSLLNTFNLTDRLVLDNEKAILELVNKPLDWESVNALLAKHQKSSKEFLARNI